MSIAKLRDFFRLEAAGGIILISTSMLALIMENSFLKNLYDSLLTTPLIIQIGNFAINKPLLLWINDGLMAIFFLLVGLEVKREVLEGQLSKKEQISLPAIAAFGGLLTPALIYSYINFSDKVAINGWAIPAATDIAFALGIISILGKKVPENLKICLVAIAIIDDLAAIIIIALFYTSNLSFLSLALASLAILVLFLLNKKNVSSITPYAIAGILLWVCVLKSGVHATLAGVIVALFIPIKSKSPISTSPLHKLEHDLHPWVAYLILPIFAFANAGVSLKGISIDMLLEPITLGITLGLFLGKQVGVMLFTFVGCLLKICNLPKDVNWKQYYGMSLITGIGFTMSLFIGTLAFEQPETQTAVRLGVLVGSILSGLTGFFVLKNSSNSKKFKISFS